MSRNYETGEGCPANAAPTGHCDCPGDHIPTPPGAGADLLAEQMRESRVVPANIGPIMRTCVRVDGTCEECGSRVIEIREHLTDDGRCAITALRHLAAENEALRNREVNASLRVPFTRDWCAWFATFNNLLQELTEAEHERTLISADLDGMLDYTPRSHGGIIGDLRRMCEVVAADTHRLAAEVERGREERDTAEQQISGALGDASAYYAVMVRAQDESLALRAEVERMREQLNECAEWLEESRLSCREARAEQQAAAVQVREEARREGAEHTQPCGCQCYAEGVADGNTQGRRDMGLDGDVATALTTAERRAAVRAWKVAATLGCPQCGKGFPGWTTGFDVREGEPTQEQCEVCGREAWAEVAALFPAAPEVG